MNNIQWYPGHMTKAMRMMEENVKLVDSLIYVLDARAPRSSINYNFNKLMNNKTVLYILNKADLVERSDVNAWIDVLSKDDKRVVAVNSATGNCVKVLSELVSINQPIIERFKTRGINKTVRAMVIGIPNSGKSTLVNALCGSKKANVGDKAGITRGKQWVSLGNGIELLDTPGTLSPSFENQDIAKHLAFIGSINEDIVDVGELSCELFSFMAQEYPQLIIERFKLDDLNGTAQELLDRAALKRGYIIRGGLVDSDRMAKAFIDDFRKHRMGKIILEKASGYNR